LISKDIVSGDYLQRIKFKVVAAQEFKLNKPYTVERLTTSEGVKTKTVRTIPNIGVEQLDPNILLKDSVSVFERKVPRGKDVLYKVEDIDISIRKLTPLEKERFIVGGDVVSSSGKRPKFVSKTLTADGRVRLSLLKSEFKVPELELKSRYDVGVKSRLPKSFESISPFIISQPKLDFRPKNIVFSRVKYVDDIGSLNIVSPVFKPSIRVSLQPSVRSSIRQSNVLRQSLFNVQSSSLKSSIGSGIGVSSGLFVPNINIPKTRVSGGFGLPNGGLNGRLSGKVFGKGLKAKYSYKASIEANLFKVKGRVNPLLAKTGLVLRPIRSGF